MRHKALFSSHISSIFLHGTNTPVASWHTVSGECTFGDLASITMSLFCPHLADTMLGFRIQGRESTVSRLSNAPWSHFVVEKSGLSLCVETYRIFSLYQVLYNCLKVRLEFGVLSYFRHLVDTLTCLSMIVSPGTLFWIIWCNLFFYFSISGTPIIWILVFMCEEVTCCISVVSHSIYVMVAEAE